MTAQIIPGKEIAANLRLERQAQVAALPASQRKPGLAVILVGDDPASAIYVRNKQRACDQVGFISKAHHLPATTQQTELLRLIRVLNTDPEIDGILVQMPLPEGLDGTAAIEAIDPAKDVDGLHPYNLGKLAQRQPVLRSCTPYGVMKLLAAIQVDCVGQRAVVVGASNMVGRPMALELLLAGATPTICSSKTQDIDQIIREADIVVAAVGIPEYVKAAWLKPGAVVIDVGINRQADGKLLGDVEYNAALQVASAITPVPGGVGPMTIAMLLENTWTAYQHNRQQN